VVLLGPLSGARIPGPSFFSWFPCCDPGVGKRRSVTELVRTECGPGATGCLRVPFVPLAVGAAGHCAVRSGDAWPVDGHFVRRPPGVTPGVGVWGSGRFGRGPRWSLVDPGAVAANCWHRRVGLAGPGSARLAGGAARCPSRADLERSAQSPQSGGGSRSCPSIAVTAVECLWVAARPARVGWAARQATAGDADALVARRRGSSGCDGAAAPAWMCARLPLSTCGFP
jgi:hypothetical protein